MKRLHAGVLLAAVAFATACPPPNSSTPDPSKSTVAVDRPTGAIADGADRVQITVTVRDTAGNPVAGATVQIAAGGTGNTLVQPAGSTDASGVATGSLATTVAESKSISASIQQGAIGSTATAAFGPGPVSAASSTVVATPASVVADGVASATITVTLRDAGGNLVGGKNVTLSATGSQNAFTQPSATDLRGVAVGVIRSTHAESKVITATVDGAALLQQPAVQFTASTASKLAFTVPPGTVQATAAISPPVQVEIQDANGNRVAGSTLPVTVSLAGGTSGAVLGGARTVAAADGVAVFADLSVDRAGTGYTLIAAGSGLGTTTSAAFDVTPGSGGGNHLAFVARPADTAAGASISPAVQVVLQDAGGNVIPNGSAIVTITLVGAGTLSGTTSVATTSGIASFGNLSIDRVQTGATLVASASGFSGATSLPFNIVPGPASRLVFSSEPSDVVSGVAISPPIRVAVQDAFGNLVTGDTRTISLAIGNNPGFATLSGATSTAAAAGVAAFNDVRLDRAGSGYTLVASASGVPSAVSAGFAVTPGPALGLVFVGMLPSFFTAGATLTTLRFVVEDAAGNIIPGASDAVTVALSGGTAGAVLSGTLTQAAVGGIATFGGLSVDKAGGGYAITATAVGLTTATSSTFVVVSAAPAKLVFIQQPGDGETNVRLPVANVAIQDAFGNATLSTALVTVSLASNPSGATLGGTTSVSALSGTAQFSNLFIDKVGTYQLGAASGTLTGATSSAFQVTFGGITGTRFAHYVQEDGGIVDVPQDLSTTAIAAYIPSGVAGFNFYPGVGTDAGTFTIAGVPSGPYYLRFANDYIATSARTVDLGFYAGGRPDVVQSVPGTYQATQLTGMAPWKLEPFLGSDYLQMWSPGANVYNGDINGLSVDGGIALADDTSFDQVLDYDTYVPSSFLVDASKGDTTYLLQLQVRDAGALYDDAGVLLMVDKYRGLVTASGPLAATVVPGSTSTISTAMSAPPARSLPLDWKVSVDTPLSFGALRAAVNPNTDPFLHYSFYLDAIPFTAYGFYVSSPDMVIMDVLDDPFTNRPDLQATLGYADPFPASWGRFADAQSVYFVPYQLPLADGGTANKLEQALIENLDLLPTFSTAPLRPQVSPITNGKVNGAGWSFNQDVSIITTPVISWSPPAVGTPTWYSVRIRQLRPVGSRVDVGNLITTGTSVQVPPGIFTPGEYYYVRITAFVDPNRDIHTAPYEQHWPRHSAQALSGLLHIVP